MTYVPTPYTALDASDKRRIEVTGRWCKRRATYIVDSAGLLQRYTSEIFPPHLHVRHSVLVPHLRTCVLNISSSSYASKTPIESYVESSTRTVMTATTNNFVGELRNNSVHCSCSCHRKFFCSSSSSSSSRNLLFHLASCRQPAKRCSI